jgi:hypothetical protein
MLLVRLKPDTTYSSVRLKPDTTYSIAGGDFNLIDDADNGGIHWTVFHA